MNGLDLLRWVLLIVGAVILIGIYAAGRRSLGARLRRRRAGRAELPEIEADTGAESLTVADPELAELGRSIRIDERDDAGLDAEPAAPLTAERPRPRPPQHDRSVPEAEAHAPAPKVEPKIVVVYVVATTGSTYHGPDIFAAAAEAGLEYGDMRIFHHYVSGDGEPQSVFSMASMVEPGWFDADEQDALQTPGLALFLQLPAPVDGVKAFETMVGTAQSIRRSLGGELRDASRSVMSHQTIAHLRDEISEYERLRRTHGGALR